METYMITINVLDKSFSYGSIAWANFILRLGTQECKNVRRVESARRQEIIYIIRSLEEEGYFWHFARLRNHYHLAIKKGLFSSSLQRASDSERADPLVVGGCSL